MEQPYPPAILNAYAIGAGTGIATALPSHLRFLVVIVDSGGRAHCANFADPREIIETCEAVAASIRAAINPPATPAQQSAAQN